jgi:carbamoyltransferase
MSTDVARPWVLGIASSHNGAVCLLHGDEIVAAIQEERLVRTKRATHPGARSSLAINYCLDVGNITPRDLDLIVLTSSASTRHTYQDLALNPALQTTRNGVRTMIVGHHMAHAVGAFATSGFTESAILVVDGIGSPWHDLSPAERNVVDVKQLARYARLRNGNASICETISMYVARGTTMQPLDKEVGTSTSLPKPGMRRFWSLGLMYQSAARQIFGEGLDGSGKMMGLAPYGTPAIPARDFYTITDGRFEFLDCVPDRYLHDDHWPMRAEEYQNLAASTQQALEDALFVLFVRLRQMSGMRKLCYAGGVALNSVANELLVQEGDFDEVFIMPAAEDSGTAIGAAYYGLWQVTGRNTCRRLPHDAVGRRYTPAETARAIEQCPAIHTVATGDVLDPVVDMLNDGKIVGWFQGRSELGPRALGQRSILCDPRRPEMKDLLNRTVKFRESFRPFAPVIPLEHLGTYFESSALVESPFMLRVVTFRDGVRDMIPAVAHVDGTGRVQTLTRDANGLFYDLVIRFYQKTGCPILLNTSFNVAGEPIVETPEDALNCLLATGLDACAFEGWLVEKDPAYRTFLDLVLRLCIDRVELDYDISQPRNASAAKPHIRTRFFESFHLDRWVEVNERMSKSRNDLLRMTTETRWGPVLHVTNAEVFEVVKRIDGRRTGWDILEALRTELGIPVNESELARVLVTLRRASIVAWTPQSFSEGVAASVSSVRAV